MEKLVTKINMKQGFLIFVIAMSIIIIIWGFWDLSTAQNVSYSFELNGEPTEDFLTCDGEWNYSNITFVPCINESGSTGAIFSELLNTSLSPQENCQLINNFSFLGFHTQNKTLAEERYKAVMPKCREINKTNINKEFLNTLDCLIVEMDGKIPICKKWRGRNLIITEDGN